MLLANQPKVVLWKTKRQKPDVYAVIVILLLVRHDSSRIAVEEVHRRIKGKAKRLHCLLINLAFVLARFTKLVEVITWASTPTTTKGARP